MLTLSFLCFLNQTRSSSNRGPVYGLTNQNRVLISRGTNGSIRELDFSHSILMTSQELRAIGDEFSLCGEKNRLQASAIYSCGRFTRNDVKVFYFNLFIISFCFVYNFVGTMPILQTRMFFRGGRMLGDCEGKMRLYFLRVLFFVF